MAQARSKQPPKKRITFSHSAPHAQKVSVCGSFCNWQTDAHPLKKDKSGSWKTIIALPEGSYEYRFLVDGLWCDDPLCAQRAPNPFGSENCVLHILREVSQAERSKIAGVGVT